MDAGQKILDAGYNMVNDIFLGQLGLIDRERFLPRKMFIRVPELWNSGFNLA